MKLKGELRKMPVFLNAKNKVEYTLSLYTTSSKDIETLSFNQFINKKLTIHYTNIILCKKCGKQTKTSFNQGFCYTCFKNAPESAECIIRPELCRAHLGEGRNIEWEEKNHNQPHIVYLAATNVVKVGVTRASQIPTRWIDQGASAAIVLAKTPNRYLAGVIEVALKSEFTDKTNWRKMLKNEIDESIDLEETKWELEELLPDDIAQYISENDNLTLINYPVCEFPTKVKSINLEKQPLVTGKLLGIKGQYLIFDENRVMNVRRHTGFQVEIGVED